jgi:DNA-3-methyladenine glycosylase I
MTDKPQATPLATGRHARKRRCWWARSADPDYVRYHDEEWGRPVHDDRRLFEMLTLEGAQAGLSWSTIARAFLAVQCEFGSFDRYLWSFVAGKPIVNRPRSGAVPARTPLSDQVSRDLMKRGFRFVGTTIVYAFLQAVGVVNDHARDCFRCPPRRPRPK